MLIIASLCLIGLDKIQNHLLNKRVDKYKQTHELPSWAKPNSGVNSFRK